MKVVVERNVDGEWYKYGTYDLSEEWQASSFVEAIQSLGRVRVRPV